MTSLDAKALDEDQDGLAFLRDVLKTAPAAESQPSKKRETLVCLEPTSPVLAVRTTRRVGLVGATALAALVVAISPAKPATPAPARNVEAIAPAKPAGAAVAVLSSKPSCPRVWLKLWVDGEGWVVRSVAKCW